MGCEESFLANGDLARRTQHFRARVQAQFLLRRTHRSAEGENPPQLAEGLFSITDEDIDMIEGLLQDHHLFYKVKSFTGREIITKLEKFTVETGETIFSKGDLADYFYIILSGAVEISGFAEGVEGKVLERGQCFGDLGIENKTSRSGTAVAKTAVRLLGLRKNHFVRVSLQLIRRAQNEIFKEIKTIQVFSFLNMHQKHKISFLAQELKFPKGAYIFRKGQSSDCLYVIRSGKVRLDVPNKQSIQINSRQSFGESSLKQQKSLRIADAVCSQTCILLAFNKHDMIKYLGNSLQEIEIANKIIWSLKREPNFTKISHIILDAMIDSKQVKHFRDGELVAMKGDAIEHFIISVEGGINDKAELQLMNCSYLKGLNFQTEDLVKRGDGMVVFLSIQQIESKFNRKFDLLLNIDHMISKEIQSYMAIQEYAKSLSLEVFQVAEVKGVGQYGPTLRVRSDSNIQFALKVFQKAKVIAGCAHESVYLLRRMNIKVAHNLIARAYRIYSDHERIYFLNKLVDGESLCECLSMQGKLPLQVVRHFSACMINILEYLHCRRILWREMKMESFVIDWDGYVNLVDLMHLQELKEDQFYIDTPSRATLYYLSPETLSGQGYGLESDFWALGVIIYRMIVGHFPFGQQINQEDPSVLDILSDQINAFGLKLPQWVPSEVKTLLKLLLNPNSLERSLISINRLKSMTLFIDYDWLGLMEKKIKHVPYLPRKPTNRIIPNETSMQVWISSQESEATSNDCLDDIQDI